MRIVFEQKNTGASKLSIVLLDWNCRESFHMLDYLNKQTVPRDQYEIIWIEYYSRVSEEIENKLKETQKSGGWPVVDKWLVMDTPENVYYHKHLMYNLGLVFAAGEIVCFCDSDAMVKPGFVQSIVAAFEKDKNIVLHLDEVRNIDKSFYPFNYPSIEKVIAKGCINLQNGKTTGLIDTQDVLHTRNYGACMCALRKDLIAIGGADEHIDYLGHICGPYDMTFRLINAGKKEIWYEKEFLYHTWHPGTDGANNYLGPHDGRNVSTTALDTIRSKRIMPLVENKAVQSLRSGSARLSVEQLHKEALSGLNIEGWDKRRLKQIKKRGIIPSSGVSLKGLFLKFSILKLILAMMYKQVVFKTKVQSENKIIPKGGLVKLRLAFAFIRRMWRNNMYSKQVCFQIISQLKSQGITEAAVYGNNDIARMLELLALKYSFKVMDFEKSNDYNGKVIVASFTGINDKAKALESLGIARVNIVRMQ